MCYDEQTFRRMKGIFFKAMKEENLKCLEPHELCQENLIRSHSVQDSRILEELAQNQHVYALHPDLSFISNAKPDEYAEPKLEFKWISIHEATTFKGLCNTHDTEIFKPIDTEELDIENKEHIFLLTYRAVLKEFATLCGTSRMMQKAFQDKVNAGVISGDVPTMEGLLPVIQMQKALIFYEYKKKYDELFLNKEYDKLYYKYIILDEKANFAVSSIFTPMEMATEGAFEYIGINIFPYNQKTYIIFSGLKENEIVIKNYIRDIMTASGVYQKYLISKAVLRNCENVVIAPVYLNTWTDKKKETILQYVKDTCFSDKVEYENQDIYLF